MSTLATGPVFWTHFSVPTSGSIDVTPNDSTSYWITATGDEGEVNASAAISVTALPTAALTASPLHIAAGESSVLSWNCENGDTFIISPEIGSVESTGSISVTPHETTTYTITAGGTCGSVTSEATITIGPSLFVEILSPLDGEVVDRPDVFVQGRVTGSQASELGVVVNGIRALVDGDMFYANHVPFAYVNATLAVQATDSDGLTGNAAIRLEPEEELEPYIKITTHEERGIPPLDTTLQTMGTFGIDTLDISQTGPEQIQLATMGDKHAFTINATLEGIYIFTANATDVRGNRFIDRCAFQVIKTENLDLLLKSLWSEFKTAMTNMDIETVTSLFTGESQNRYFEAFSKIQDRLPNIASEMQGFEMVYAYETMAKYRTNRTHTINGQDVVITYYIYFSIDDNGLWKIEKL